MIFAGFTGLAMAGSSGFGNKIFDPGKLLPVDSQLMVQVGDMAPEFELPAVSGKSIALKSFRGKKNVLISFVPAAWTPVCSDQWPGYNITREIFEGADTIVLGISVDNIPTLFAWTGEMGTLWFDVLSDFWPHGDVSRRYGVLRSDGMADRALFLIDKTGRLRFVHVGDINVRPDLKMIVDELEKINF
jgi:peroxiredoxin (alkyl hydroperoxide reductase subunit C)